MGKGRERSDIQIFFVPTVEQRLKIRIPITPEFTVLAAATGRQKSI
jgi:hypothetical protein